MMRKNSHPVSNVQAQADVVAAIAQCKVNTLCCMHHAIGEPVQIVLYLG